MEEYQTKKYVLSYFTFCRSRWSAAISLSVGQIVGEGAEHGDDCLLFIIRQAREAGAKGSKLGGHIYREEGWTRTRRKKQGCEKI